MLWFIFCPLFPKTVIYFFVRKPKIMEWHIIWLSSCFFLNSFTIYFTKTPKESDGDPLPRGITWKRVITVSLTVRVNPIKKERQQAQLQHYFLGWVFEPLKFNSAKNVMSARTRTRKSGHTTCYRQWNSTRA